MAEGGFDNPVYDDRIEEEETNVDEYDPGDMVQDQESQYEARGYNTEILRSMTVRNAVDRYYEKLEEMGQGKPTIIDPNDFTLVDGKDLRLKRFPDVKLIKRNGDPYKLSTIASNKGSRAIREGLGFSDYGYKKN